MYKGPDRRVFRRIKGQLAVKYRLNSKNGRLYSAATEDIGGGGIRIPLFKKLKPGTVLNMEIFKANSNISTSFRGKVAWVSATPIKGKKKKCYEAGIKFIDLGFLYIGLLMSELESQNLSSLVSS